MTRAEIDAEIRRLEALKGQLDVGRPGRLYQAHLSGRLYITVEFGPGDVRLVSLGGHQVYNADLARDFKYLGSAEELLEVL